jgi:hypothetical protein
MGERGFFLQTSTYFWRESNVNKIMDALSTIEKGLLAHP